MAVELLATAGSLHGAGCDGLLAAVPLLRIRGTQPRPACSIVQGPLAALSDPINPSHHSRSLSLRLSACQTLAQPAHGTDTLPQVDDRGSEPMDHQACTKA